MKQLEEEFGDKLRVEYWHYPLSFHKFAETSAIASVAAAKQGKFWEYVDLLYADLKNQEPTVLEKYASDLGMDVAQFKADVKDKALLTDVRLNAAAGGKIGVRGTPSMFINGTKTTGRDFDAMKVEVEAEVAAVQALIDAGKSPAEARKERILASEGGVAYLDFVENRKGLAVDLAPPKPPAPKKPTPPDTTVYPAEIFDGDPQKGPDDALVTIVECTDFQ